MRALLTVKPYSQYSTPDGLLNKLDLDTASVPNLF